MKYIIYKKEGETGLNKIIDGQISKFGGFVPVELDSSSYKSAVLKSLEGVKDEYVCIIPPNNIPISGPHLPRMERLAGIAEANGLDYIRMTRVNDKHLKEIDDNLFAELTDSFPLVPHIIRTDVFRDMVSRIVNNHNFLFWKSLETTDYIGAIYFNQAAQSSNNISYWKCDLFDVITGALTTKGKWSEQYVNFGEKPLEPLFAEYSITSEVEGVGSEGYL